MESSSFLPFNEFVRIVETKQTEPAAATARTEACLQRTDDAMILGEAEASLPQVKQYIYIYIYVCVCVYKLPLVL